MIIFIFLYKRIYDVSDINLYCNDYEFQCFFLNLVLRIEDVSREILYGINLQLGFGFDFLGNIEIGLGRESINRFKRFLIVLGEG